jgi:hypothetical protein
MAAARVVSILAACRSLADAPTDQTIRNALAATLPEMIELERRLNLALVIETSYRQMNKARIKTCTRDPRRRLFFVGIALLQRNVWGKPSTISRTTNGRLLMAHHPLRAAGILTADESKFHLSRCIVVRSWKLLRDQVLDFVLRDTGCINSRDRRTTSRQLPRLTAYTGSLTMGYVTCDGDREQGNATAS